MWPVLNVWSYLHLSELSIQVYQHLHPQSVNISEKSHWEHISVTKTEQSEINAETILFTSPAAGNAV